MPTIVMAATKGGSGKTTLAAALAVEAARHGRVGMLDLDPQQSLARWHELRSDGDAKTDNPHLIDTGKYPDRTLARAVRDDWDWLIVDCPPGSLRISAQGIAHADLVVIPARPSPLDVEAIDVMAELCVQYERPFVFVLNAVVPRDGGMVAGARSYLTVKGEVLDIEIANRLAYASAMVGGRTAGEKDGPAKAEIAALWKAIVARVRAATKKRLSAKAKPSR
jgi:chromosome partitioning protein